MTSNTPRSKETIAAEEATERATLNANANRADARGDRLNPQHPHPSDANDEAQDARIVAAKARGASSKEIAAIKEDIVAEKSAAKIAAKADNPHPITGAEGPPPDAAEVARRAQKIREWEAANGPRT